MPFDTVQALLQRHATLGRGPVGDTEIVFADDQVASYGLLVGDARQGAQCVTFVRPRFDEPLRHLLYDLMSQCGAAVFDDALASAYVLGDAPLPEAMAAACVTSVQRISSPQQLWPAGLWLPAPDATERPALLFDNPNPQGHNFVLFDHADFEKKRLYMDFETRAAACNPGTLRALRNVFYKLDLALATNPEFQAEFHFTDPEANLRILEAPKIAEARAPVQMVVPGEVMMGAPVAQPQFVMDAACFFAMRQRASDCREQAKAHGITIAAGLAGAAALDQLLVALHAALVRGRAGHAAGEDNYNEQVQHWAMLAGACLGEMIHGGIGAQWGMVTLLGHKLVAVHTHTGRNCWPWHVAFNRLMNDTGESIVDYLRELARSAHSPTPRNADIAADIPAICHILLGHGQMGGGLPLQAQIPVAKLDYSLDSLHHLDAWLAAVHAQRATLQGAPLSNLMLTAGAYLGECVRRNAGAHWQWTNYDDFFTTHPANPNLHKDVGTCAFLIGPSKAVLPMHTCNITTWLEAPRSVHAQALQWLDGNIRKPAAPQAAAGAVSTAAPAAAPSHALDIDIAALVAALPQGDRKYPTFLPPMWMDGDELIRVFDHMPDLLKKGRAVWAHLVQANNALFEPGTYDSPAEVVYDPRGRLTPAQLAPVARELLALKNTQPSDPEEAHVAHHLTTEITRAFAMSVPQTISRDGLLLSSLLIVRKHLPNHRVSLGHFPVLISDEHPGSVMVLPGRWWPQAFAEEWGIEEAPHDPHPPKTADGLAPIDPPNVRAAKDQILHVMKPPVPFSDDAAWAALDEALAREQERLMPQPKGIMGKLFKRKVEEPPEERDPDPVYSKYIRHMLGEYPDVCDMPADLGAEVISITVASASVNYVVETARREYGLTVFDSNSAAFSLIYRPAKKVK